jgi:hypothetical protein
MNLVTSAVVGNRLPVLGLKIPFNQQFAQFYIPTSAPMKASEDWIYTALFGAGAPQSIAFGEAEEGFNGMFTVVAPPITLDEGNSLYVELFNGKAGDKQGTIITPALTYERIV